MDDLNKLFEIILDCLTYQNISFILGLFGSLGTAWSIIQSRKKIYAKLQYFGYDETSFLALAYIQFVNKSRLPISITDVSLKIGKDRYPCEKLPSLVDSHAHRRLNQVSLHDFYNVQLPLNLGNLGGSSGYFLFVLPQGIHIDSSKPLLFEVCTNRGKAKEMKLPYPQ